MVGCQDYMDGVMASDTRELFLDTAEALFADRGFYGVSIAAIADELGLTKQALLHHFKSKEKLYGEVLARISTRFEAISNEIETDFMDPIDRLTAFFSLLRSARIGPAHQTRLLMRELLDNRQRADTAETWYLKPFLKNLTEMVLEVPNWSNASESEALALVYQWLGAINYFAVSEPTLSGIYGKKRYKELADAYSRQLTRLIVSSLNDR